jgi:hypothetical protein
MCNTVSIVEKYLAGKIKLLFLSACKNNPLLRAESLWKYTAIQKPEKLQGV